MIADPRFQSEPKIFWSYVRLLSQHCGYTERGTGQIKVLSVGQLASALGELGLDSQSVLGKNGRGTELGLSLVDYFSYRATLLNRTVEPLLMDAPQAEQVFKQIRSTAKSSREATMNKQKGEKRKPAYLTEIVRMLLEQELRGLPCNFDPRELTTFSRGGAVLRTLSRRVDGAFPSAMNPIAIWEIKEYYHTTTFGSRVADGVYETLLDGMELEELRVAESVECHHVLVVDSRYTWWECGRSYLCRIIDMLNMGYVDEVIFGREALRRIPEIGRQWKAALPKRTA